MAKTYESDFKIKDLDKVAGDLLNQFILKSGVDTAGTVEALKAMGVKNIYGFDKFTDAQSQGQLERFAKEFAKNGYVAAAALGRAMAKYDPFKLNLEGATRADSEDISDEERMLHIGAISTYTQNADVVLNALSEVKIDEKSTRRLFRRKPEEDFRCYEDMTAGIGRFYEQYKKSPEKFSQQGVWGVLAAAAYAKEMYNEGYQRVNILKSFQTKIGGLSVSDPDSVLAQALHAIGVKPSEIEDVLTGQNVPGNVVRENAEGYVDGIQGNDIRGKTLGRISLSGMKTYARMADQTSSLILRGLLVERLNLQDSGRPVGRDVTGTSTEYENYTAYKFSALDQRYQRELLPFLLRGNETEFAQVEQRLEVVAKAIEDVTKEIMNNLVDENGVLQIANFSEQVQNYLNGSYTDQNGNVQPLFADEQAKLDYIRETITVRSLEAAIVSGAASATDPAEALRLIAEQTSLTSNENFYVPAFNEDGTPIIGLYNEAKDEVIEVGTAQAYIPATLFNEEKSLYILYHNGQNLIYTGDEPDFEKDPDAFSKVLLSLQKEYGDPRFDAEGNELPPKIDNLDLGGARIEDFRKSDMMSQIYSFRHDCTRAFGPQTQQEGSQDQDTHHDEEENHENSNPVVTTEGPVLFRSLPLYQQYVAEFKNLLERSGLKITLPEQQNQQEDHSDTEDETHSDTEDETHSDTEDETHSDTEDETHSDNADEEHHDNPSTITREEIRQKVRGNSTQKDENAQPVAQGKFAALQAKLAKGLFGENANPSLITAQDMIAIVARIRSWDNANIAESLNAYCTQFKESFENQTKYDTPESYLSKYTFDVQAECAKHTGADEVMKEIAGFVSDYKEQFAEEEFEAREVDEFASPTEVAKEKYWVQTDLQKEALEYAATEQLATLLSRENQSLTSGEVPVVKFEKIPEAAPVAAAEDAPAQ